jgi:predicted ABC-type sugar transport system permease subunit
VAAHNAPAASFVGGAMGARGARRDDRPVTRGEGHMGYYLGAFLGSTTIRPGRFNVPGTIVGVFFVAVSVNGLTLAGAADWVDPVFNGAAVVIAVSASTLLAHRRGTMADA